MRSRGELGNCRLVSASIYKNFRATAGSGVVRTTREHRGRDDRAKATGRHQSAQEGKGITCSCRRRRTDLVGLAICRAGHGFLGGVTALGKRARGGGIDD